MLCFPTYCEHKDVYFTWPYYGEAVIMPVPLKMFSLVILKYWIYDIKCVLTSRNLFYIDGFVQKWMYT